MINFIENLGSKVLELIDYVGKLAFLFTHSLKMVSREKIRRENLLQDMETMGINSFPLVGIIATFTGMVMVMETAKTLKKFGGESYVGGIVSLSMVRELGPVIVALIVAGRVGASIAAELGTMKITEQIDALEVLGVDPAGYLVSPRLIAGMIMLPFLNLLAVFLSIVGGYFIGVYMMHIAPGSYINQSLRFIATRDVFVGITKAFVFGVLIVIASCYEGLRATGGAEGVGRATTKAVVHSFFLIILSNLILTSVFYFLK